MKLTPFAVIYGGNLNPNAILSSNSTVLAASVAQLNAAIAEVNANFANYGYAATPALPVIPAIPNPGVTAPQGIGYFQSAAPGSAGPNYGPPSSFLLIDAFTANGYSDPSTALDQLTAEATMVALTLAIASLSTAAAAAITVQPTNQSIVHGANGQFALTATGAGVTYEWFIKLPANAFYQRVVNGAVFGGQGTNTLTVTAPTVALHDQTKVRCIVSSVSGVQDVASNIVTLTVT